LALLYRALSTDDLRLRFFGVYHPKSFLEHGANAATEGRYGLVAVVDGPDARIVAEADYFLLPNGDGELAVTVARTGVDGLVPTCSTPSWRQPRRRVCPTWRRRSSSRTAGCSL
jgi:hypothetical protein